MLSCYIFLHCILQIENLSVSFSDGRGLCYLLHHYLPTLLPRSEIKDATTMSQQQLQNSGGLDCSLDDSFGAMTYSYGKNPKQFEEELLQNEKKNFKIFHEKVSNE